MYVNIVTLDTPLIVLVVKVFVKMNSKFFGLKTLINSHTRQSE
jgi:hypothetical protein